MVADEIYASLVYDDFPFTSFASLGEDIKKKTVIINGPSKSYSMTGWRIGYTLGPADVIAGMAKIQSHTTSNAASISQRATQEAVGGPQFEVAKMVQEFGRRRNYAYMKLQAMPGVSCFKPQGAFYLFPNVKCFYDKEFNGTPIRNSNGLAYYLLREAGVAVVPGDSFGSDDYIRLSYATSMENLEKGLDRIGRALARLQPARKAKRVALANYTARTRKPVPVDAGLTTAVRDGLVAEVESRLGLENVFEWNAVINGVVVQLRTNVAHLNDFWVDNWYPAQLEAGLEPHGIIYAVDGIPGREPRALYNTETKTGVLVNCDAYGPLRSLALGLAADVGERSFGLHSVRGMSVDAGGEGLALIGPPGTKKTDLFFGLLRDPRYRFHAGDVFFVRYAGKAALADAVERKAYLPTSAVEHLRPPGRALRRQQVRERRPAQGRLQGCRVPAGRGLPAGPRLAVLLQGGQGRARPRRSQLDRRPGGGRPADDDEEDRAPAQRHRVAGRGRAVARGGPEHPGGGREPGHEGGGDGQARSLLQPPPPGRNRGEAGAAAGRFPAAVAERPRLALQFRRGRRRGA